MARRSCRAFQVVFLLMWGAASAGADVFSYQGRLQDSGQPVVGPADLEFRLFDAATVGTQIGPVEQRLAFSDFHAGGEFSIDLDFGSGAFDGSDRWLEIEVDGTPLAPRQQVRPAPYALFALDGNAGPQGDPGPPGP